MNARLPVLVVGAGPAGLSAALGLRASGLPAVVLEGRTVDAVRPGSRAAYLHGESLRHLERMSPGLGGEIAAHGLMWHTKRSFWRGTEAFVKTYPPLRKAGLPPFTSLPQVRTEDLMMAACKADDVQFHWDRRVTGVESTDSGVRVEDSAGEVWDADYVIAADGSRSVIRDAIACPLQGTRSRNIFVVVDVDEDAADPLPLERVFHYGHPAVGGRNVLLVPFAGGWRADLNLRVSDDPQLFSSPEGVRHWISRVFSERYGERVRWVSTYRFAQQVASGFVDDRRRVLLIGEAAHLFAPFGARGMNSSISDALAAVAAVRDALDARTAGETVAAVDRFAAERLEAARYNWACANAALEHMLAHKPSVWLRRHVAAGLAFAGRRAGAWLDSAPYGPTLADRQRAGSSY